MVEASWGEGVFLVGIIHGDAAAFGLVAAEDDEVAEWGAFDVVVATGFGVFAADMVEVGGAEAGEDGGFALEVATDEGAGEVFEADFTVGFDEAEVGFGGGAAFAAGAGGLEGEFGADIDGGLEPGGVDDAEVGGIEDGIVASLEGVEAEHDAEGAAGFEAGDLVDNCLEGDIVSVVGVDCVEAGWAAGGIGGLGLKGYIQGDFLFRDAAAHRRLVMGDGLRWWRSGGVASTGGATDLEIAFPV
ncbi:MAG: hypothetical protein RI897_1826 [Verrucomicrobiota bacterium]